MWIPKEEQMATKEPSDNEESSVWYQCLMFLTYFLIISITVYLLMFFWFELTKTEAGFGVGFGSFPLNSGMILK